MINLFSLFVCCEVVSLSKQIHSKAIHDHSIRFEKKICPIVRLQPECNGSLFIDVSGATFSHTKRHLWLHCLTLFLQKSQNIENTIWFRTYQKNVETSFTLYPIIFLVRLWYLPTYKSHNINKFCSVHWSLKFGFVSHFIVAALIASVFSEVSKLNKSLDNPLTTLIALLSFSFGSYWKCCFTACV